MLQTHINVVLLERRFISATFIIHRSNFSSTNLEELKTAKTTCECGWVCVIVCGRGGAGGRRYRPSTLSLKNLLRDTLQKAVKQ